MKRIIGFITDKRVLTIIGLIALSVLIWLGGPFVHFGEDNVAPLGSVVARLVAIIVLFGLWGLTALLGQWKNKQRTAKLLNEVQGLDAGNDDGAQTNQSGEEVAILQKRFTDALTVLKKTKFQHKGGSKALYDLPWYIVIGPPGSGKTTALVNSGLEFPLSDQLGKGAIGGIGGTRNCDWWFTNEAVILDTAGRYTTQDSHKVVDSKAWQGFLDLLIKHRKRRPINGAIIAISIQDILTQTSDERLYHARTIRSRIDELVEHLGINFPIYVTFTKCDLVAGFSEFFEEFGLEQREQVWGMTFPLPDEGKPQAFDNKLFEYKYSELLSRLQPQVLDRVQRERDPQRRALIYNFPNQFETMRSPIEDFLTQTFGLNRFQTQPLLRGVYFSSGTQEGTPIDRMMSSVASNFGLPSEAVRLTPGQGKAFFINRLFTNVIFPEAEMVGSNRQYELLLKWMRRGAFGALAFLFVVSIGVWTTAYSRNQTYLEQVSEHLDRYKDFEVNISENNHDLRLVIPALQELKRASEIYEQENLPWLVGLGLHDSRVEIAAKKTYLEKLQTLLLPRIDWRFQQYLMAAKSTDPRLHESLLAYLMLGDSDRFDPAVVKDWLLSDWENQFRGQDEVQQVLTTHLDMLLLNPLEPLALNKQALDRGRAELRKVPVAAMIYNRIKSDPTFSREVDLRGLLGDSTRTVFANKKNSTLFSMPFMFTKEGYKAVDLSKDSPVIKEMFSDRWILGGEATAVYNNNELGKITERIRGHYMAEYIDRWGRFLNGMSVNAFSDLQQSRRILALLADPVYSPILAVLKVTSENTELSPKIPAVKLKNKKAGAIASFFSGDDSTGEGGVFKQTPVDKHFRELNLLSAAATGAPTRISGTLLSLRNVQAYLDEIILAPDITEAAYNAAKGRMLAGGGDVIKQLRIDASSLPSSVQRWLFTVADETWRLVLLNAKSHVNNEWKSQVYRKYVSALSNRYPLYRNAVDELAVFDFAEFFKPEGSHDRFVQKFIAPFVEVDDAWAVKRLDGRGLAIAPESIDQMRRAVRIKNMLFATNPTTPSFSFKMKPYRMDSSVRKFELSFGDQRLRYTHGPKISKNMNWPGDGGTNVRMTFEDLNDSIKRVTYDGPWALLRLLDESTISQTRRSNVYHVTFSTLGRKATWQVTARSVNNPFQSQSISRYRCPEAL
ncbi:hypothetical protein A9Q81_05660 [Gammaproteobacteria bacterium 42_54_T18]|nr:hypothetical protein A9Q81_05660 [Gammaproteobacteria bacterium 42_54_T18]